MNLKISLILALLFVEANACVCYQDIMSGFKNSYEFISKVIDDATEKIENDLIPAIEKNTSGIDKQNKELEKLIQAYSQEVLNKKEIIFLLQKIEKL